MVAATDAAATIIRLAQQQPVPQSSGGQVSTSQQSSSIVHLLHRSLSME
jgi:hypothetical protein